MQGENCNPENDKREKYIYDVTIFQYYAKLF